MNEIENMANIDGYSMGVEPTSSQKVRAVFEVVAVRLKEALRVRGACYFFMMSENGQYSAAWLC